MSWVLGIGGEGGGGINRKKEEERRNKTGKRNSLFTNKHISVHILYFTHASLLPINLSEPPVPFLQLSKRLIQVPWRLRRPTVI